MKLVIFTLGSWLDDKLQQWIVDKVSPLFSRPHGKTLREVAMKHEDSGQGAGSVMFSFLLGGVVGAGVALLLAPRAGSETRAQILELAEDVKGRTGGYYGQVKNKAGDYFEQVKDSVATALDKGKGVLEEKKSAITTAVQAAIDAYEKETGKDEEA
jgi:gas vesicle protein